MNEALLATLPVVGALLLTRSEVADLLRVSTMTVLRLVARRELPVYRVRGRLRFARRDVLTYLDRQRTEAGWPTEYGRP